MPSDSSGVFTLAPGYLAVTGTTIQASQHNPPLEDLAEGLTARLSRSGSAPMTGPLKLADGTASIPSMTFQSNGGTGFYKTTAGIGVSIGGVQVAEFGSGGISLPIGLLLSYAGTGLPQGFVLPYGQTLLRSAYPKLWTFAQTEIANSSTFYNNGDGSTTFGIGDMRGRIAVGPDNIGGPGAGRIPTFGYWATAGASTVALSTANLPPYTPAGTIANGAITTTIGPGSVFGVTSGSNANGGSSFTAGRDPSTQLTASSSQAASSFAGAAQGGSSTAFSVLQPSYGIPFILYAGN